jgi:hypothetical protein
MKRLLRGFKVQDVLPAVSGPPSVKVADSHPEILEDGILR